MAIKIPSSHIYDISIDPVIDNDVDSVETTIYKMSTQLKYDTPVYDNYFDNIDLTVSMGISSNEYVKTSPTNPLPAYLRIDTFDDIKKTNLDVAIPQIIDDGIIRKIYTGKIDGSDRIKCSIICQKSIGKVNVHWIGNNEGKISILRYGDKIQTETNMQDISVKDYFLDLVASKQYFSDEQKNGIVNDNLGTAQATETEIDGKTEYNLSFTNILCGFIRYNYVGNQYAIDQETGTFVSICDYIEIVPQKVNISINGDLLYLDKTEIDKTIGDGNNVFLFDSNELIQSTNIPTPEEKYQTIIDQWQNGKQVATISCPIADYDTTNDRLAISTSTQKIQVKCERLGILGVYYLYELNTDLLNEGDTVILNNGAKFIVPEIFKQNGQFFLPTNALLSGKLVVGETYTVENIKIPMTFDIGDIVEPYVFTNKGDRPLSYNKDFAPKQFEVVGTGISMEQGITQELTLVEYIPSNTEE